MEEWGEKYTHLKWKHNRLGFSMSHFNKSGDTSYKSHFNLNVCRRLKVIVCACMWRLHLFYMLEIGKKSVLSYKHVVQWHTHTHIWIITIIVINLILFLPFFPVRNALWTFHSSVTTSKLFFTLDFSLSLSFSSRSSVNLWVAVCARFTYQIFMSNAFLCMSTHQHIGIGFNTHHRSWMTAFTHITKLWHQAICTIRKFVY